MTKRKSLYLAFLIISLVIVTALGSSAQTLFYEGTFNANGNCAYYGSFPSDISAVYMLVNGDGPYGLVFNDERNELLLQSGSVVFKFTNNYWITTRNYSCWSELGITPETITLATNFFNFSDGNQDYYDSVFPLIQWAFGDDFSLYTVAELEIALTDVNVYEFATLLFTPKIFLSVLYYAGLTLICTLVIGFIPMLFLFVWRFIFSAFFNKRRWWHKK